MNDICKAFKVESLILYWHPHFRQVQSNDTWHHSPQLTPQSSKPVDFALNGWYWCHIISIEITYCNLLERDGFIFLKSHWINIKSGYHWANQFSYPLFSVLGFPPFFSLYILGDIAGPAGPNNMEIQNSSRFSCVNQQSHCVNNSRVIRGQLWIVVLLEFISSS